MLVYLQPPLDVSVHQRTGTLSRSEDTFVYDIRQYLLMKCERSKK